MVSDHNPDTLAAGHAPDELANLREEFRGFKIWKELIGERTRYIARSLSLGSRLHTVVTADLGELRTALEQGVEQQAAALPYDTTVPNIARMYNYWTIRLPGRSSRRAPTPGSRPGCCPRCR
jgi:hypothetical protein